MAVREPSAAACDHARSSTIVIVLPVNFVMDDGAGSVRETVV
jgi:hypothetical protein